ncbi:MAG TPA: thioredoxin family protein [Bacteroidales bacterium]|nr:thioredoxin family protein [Bacteroidales bacterium]
MKQITFSIILVAVLVSSCRTTKPVSGTTADQTQPSAAPSAAADKPFDYFQQTSWLLGYFDPSGLKRQPHAEWFYKGFDSYMPSSEYINKLLDIGYEGLTIKIVMGTWCPDSRREVPGFMKILDQWHFPAEKVTFIGVDVNKLSPVSEFEGLHIERVPTFIFYKNNIEAGRIIEVPKTSLEQDMVNILQGMK